jgi:hypothetical protein
MWFRSFLVLPLLLVACTDQEPVAAPSAPPELRNGRVGFLDAAEETHLVFMREEEKLARDVYITLGTIYPALTTFDKIDDSEQSHTDTMAKMLKLFRVKDPSTSDDIGVFTGAEYGWYFTDKFAYLVGEGSTNGLAALYVGAFIEELDMHDIAHCPAVILEMHDEIEEDGCGLAYTDEAELSRTYGRLLDGSKSHLRAYVKAIEQTIGEGTYVAQYLTQAEVDEILGR